VNPARVDVRSGPGFVGIGGFEDAHDGSESDLPSFTSAMDRLEIQGTTKDELRQEIERSAKQAVEAGLREMRETIDRLTKMSHLQKDWLTLEEAARYADITTPTLRDWRENGLPEAEVEGRIYIEREALDEFIASHAED